MPRSDTSQVVTSNAVAVPEPTVYSIFHHPDCGAVYEDGMGMTISSQQPLKLPLVLPALFVRMDVTFSASPLDARSCATRKLARVSTTTFAFDYRAREPGPPLRRAVASIWYARGTVPYRRERIAPTGSTVAVFVLGDPIVESQTWPRATSVRATEGFLIGPHDRPVINEPTGETVAVGIITTAVGCRSVFGLEPLGIAGQVVDLVERWPTARAIRGSLLRLTDPEAMLDLVADYLTAALDLTDPGLDRCERAIALLGDDPTLPIASVARTVGVSHGHLDREFARIIGLSPRRLARLLRVQRLLEGIDAHGDVAWASLAASLGWSDQSHLIRDVKRHTGVSPSWYVAAQRAWISPGTSPALAGFVPEPM
ncbi:hypothetical protein BH20CHL7_BH20CHL7_07100 [soil metagenome]